MIANNLTDKEKIECVIRHLNAYDFFYTHYLMGDPVSIEYPAREKRSIKEAWNREENVCSMCPLIDRCKITTKADNNTIIVATYPQLNWSILEKLYGEEKLIIARPTGNPSCE